MNERDVRLTYRFLGHEKETELRIIDPTKKEAPVSYWVTDEDEFVDICRKWDGQRNIYAGINERSHQGTRCDEVIHINAIVFDIDSVHVKDLPATEFEREGAGIAAREVFSYLKKNGRTPFLAMSGNGWQIWVKMDIDIDTETKKKVEAVIKDIHRGVVDNYTTKECMIDNIGDLARVIKVIGTTALKRFASEDRPYVESYWARKPLVVNPDMKWGEKIVALSKNYTVQYNLNEEIEGFPYLTDEDADKYVFKLPKYVRSWYEGKYDKFKSRSEAEYAIIIQMARAGITKPVAYALMNRCKIGNWQTDNKSYRNLTLNKAFLVAKSEPDE